MPLGKQWLAKCLADFDDHRDHGRHEENRQHRWHRDDPNSANETDDKRKRDAADICTQTTRWIICTTQNCPLPSSLAATKYHTPGPNRIMTVTTANTCAIG